MKSNKLIYSVETHSNGCVSFFELSTNKVVKPNRIMRAVTFGGKPVTLAGEQVKAGDKALEFIALDNSLKPIKMSDFKGKVKLISVFPSIDTSVCSVQNHKFNKTASEFGDKVVF